VTGALALMLLTAARESTRTDGRGDLVPLAEQDRAHWDSSAIAEGVGLLEEVLPRGRLGRFQLQAAIAAVHAEAATWAETDWRQISLLYAMLEQLAPGPAVTLNRAVAVGMALGPELGLAVLEPLLDDPAMVRHHRTHAVRAHLLELAGDRKDALEAYGLAARLTASIPEQRYLNGRSAALATRSPRKR
jgi:predicted RNA polymerase sigma factor